MLFSRWRRPLISFLKELSRLKNNCGTAGLGPNIAFKPKLHRYANNMADKACHVASYALQFGLT